MPDPLIAVQTLLKAIAEVTAIVETRVYRIGSIPTTPQKPYIIISSVSDVPGITTNTSESDYMRVQCSCIAATDPAVEALSQILKKKLPCNDVILPAGTDFIRVIRIENAGATPDQDTDVPVYLRHRDFRILYTY